MKIARATAKDLDAGMMLLGLLSTVSSGYYPSGTDDNDDGPLRFDGEDPEHLVQLWKLLKECFDAAPGFHGRLILGAVALMDPRNEVIDPDADCLELNTKWAAAMNAADRYRGLLLWTLYHHQGGSSKVGLPIRRALGIGRYAPMTEDQIAKGKEASLSLEPPVGWSGDPLMGDGSYADPGQYGVMKIDSGIDHGDEQT